MVRVTVTQTAVSEDTIQPAAMLFKNLNAFQEELEYHKLPCSSNPKYFEAHEMPFGFEKETKVQK